MTEPQTYTIDAESWRRELKAIGWDIMQVEPTSALERIEGLLRQLVDDYQRDADILDFPGCAE